MSIDYLANINNHPRDVCISFQDEGHIYTIKHTGCLAGDTGFTSVTTYIHCFVEKFDANKIINNMMKSSNWPNNKYYGKTKLEIKLLWDNNGKEAATAGTKLHYDIECAYNNMSVENDSNEYKYFLNFHKDFNHLLKPYRTEWLIFDEELRLSGSVDMVFQNDNGALEIYDWKRSKEIVKNSRYNKWMKNSIISHLPDTNFWHYSLQLNIYKAILNKNYGIVVTDLYLICLHPNYTNYLRIPAADLQSEVKLLFDERKNYLQNNK